MADQIVYTIHALPGGVDGMDRDAKGGPVRCTLDKSKAVKKAGRDTRYKITSDVVDLDEVLADLVARMTPVERLAVQEYAMCRVTVPHRLKAL